MIDTVVEKIFRLLVYGEGDGANEGYARERRPDAYNVVSAILSRGDGEPALTTIEAMETFGTICVAHAVGEGIEFVATMVRCCQHAEEEWRTLVVES